MKKFVIAFFMIFAQMTYAQIDRKGNGGDEVAISFKKAAADGIQRLDLQLSTQQMSLLQTLFSQVSVVTVENALPLKTDKVVQESTAVNIPSEKLIYVSRSRWNEINNENLRQAIAAHEYLSVAGIEKTGDYHLSSQLHNGEDVILNKVTRLVCTDAQYGEISIHDKKGDSEAVMYVQFKDKNKLSLAGTVGFDELALFASGRDNVPTVTAILTETDSSFKNEKKPNKGGIIYLMNIDWGPTKGNIILFHLAFGGLLYHGECVTK